MAKEITNYFHIDTSAPEGLRELNKAIAQELGYEVRLKNGSQWWLVRDGLGQECNTSYKDAWDAVPRYSTDLNAAMSLINPVSRVLFKLYANPHLNEDNRWCAVLDGAPDGKWTCNDSTPALAICGVWLMWKQAQS